MSVVDVSEATTQLSELLERVEAGEEVVIVRAGIPVARLVPAHAPVRAPHRPRTPGRWKGRMILADDFDATPEGLLIE